jgi:hypothetical protein
MILLGQALRLVPRLVLGGLWTVITFLRDLMTSRRSVPMSSSLRLVPRLVLGGLWTVIIFLEAQKLSTMA